MPGPDPYNDTSADYEQFEKEQFAYPLRRDSVTCHVAESGISRRETGGLCTSVLTKSRLSGYDRDAAGADTADVDDKTAQNLNNDLVDADVVTPVPKD